MLQPYINLLLKYPGSFLMDYCLLASFISGVLNFRFLDAASRSLLAMVGIILGIEVVLIHYAAHKQNNHFLFNLISLVTVVGIGAAYSSGTARRSEKLAIGVLVALYSAVYSYAFQWSRVIEYLLAVERLLLLGFVLLYFRRLATQMMIPSLGRHAMFWASVGVILYSSATFFTLLVIRFPFFDKELYMQQYALYWDFTQWAAGFLYLTLGAAFWVRRVEVLKPAI